MKYIYKYVIVIVIILVGIGALFLLNNKKDEQVIGDFSKSQLVEVYDYSTNKLVIKYQNKVDIERLIKNLSVEKWEMGEKELSDSKKYLIKLYQKPTKTILNKKSNELKEVGTITIYSSGKYVDVSVNKINLTFKTNKNVSSLFD